MVVEVVVVVVVVVVVMVMVIVVAMHWWSWSVGDGSNNGGDVRENIYSKAIGRCDGYLELLLLVAMVSMAVKTIPRKCC